MRSAQPVYRNQTRNSATLRHRTHSRLPAAPQKVMPRARRKSGRKVATAPMPTGLSVIAGLVLVLSLIGIMLVVSLNWQRSALALTQEEVALRSSLSHIADEHQQLLIDERRASNPNFTAARAADAGMGEIKLDERTATLRKLVKPAVTAKAPARPTGTALQAGKSTATRLVTTTPTKAKSSGMAIKTVSAKVPNPERATTPLPSLRIAQNAHAKAALAR